MATARRLIFLEFLKESIADLITLLFSSLQDSEGGGDVDSRDSCSLFIYFFQFDLGCTSFRYSLGDPVQAWREASVSGSS